MESILFIRKTFSVLLMVLLAVLLSSCGGGGSSDDSLRYSGSTEAAVITANNAVELTLGAYYGGPVIVDIPINRTAEASGDKTQLLLQHGTLLYSWPISKMIENFTAYGDTGSQLRTIETATEIISGSCGGSATVTLHLDDTNGDFTGTIQSNNYCEDGGTISGTINVSGNVDLNAGEFTNIKMASNYLIKDNNSGKVYKVENHVISAVILTDRVETTFLGGRYYHPDYGYVDLVSEQPFIQYLGDFAPSSGELSIAGAIQTKALLTVHNINDVEITADTDGDGIFEWSSGNLN